jgi:hypothetical protein
VRRVPETAPKDTLSPIKQNEIGAMRQLALVNARELAAAAAAEHAAMEHGSPADSADWDKLDLSFRYRQPSFKNVEHCSSQHFVCAIDRTGGTFCRHSPLGKLEPSARRRSSENDEMTCIDETSPTVIAWSGRSDNRDGIWRLAGTPINTII